MVGSVYLDTSVVVPTLVAEATSELVDTVLRSSGRAIVSQFTAGEVASALSRLVRTNLLSSDAARRKLDQFDDWCVSGAHLVDVEPADVRLAAMFVRRFELKLRMPDALQLAICRRFAVPLLTLDRPLIDAAVAIGVAVVPIDA